MLFNLFPFYLVFLFLFVLSGIFLSPLKVRISIDNLRKDNNVSLKMVIYLLGYLKIFSFKKAIFVKELKELNGTGLSIWKEKGELLKKSYLRKIFFQINRYIRTLRWKKIDIYIKIGTGNAALTGMLTGFLHQLAAFFSVYFPQFYVIEQRPRIYIYPSFGAKELIFSFYIEFYTRSIQLVYYFVPILWQAVFRTKIQLLWRMIRYGRTSDTGLDDNRYGKFKGNGRCYQGGRRCSRNS